MMAQEQEQTQIVRPRAVKAVYPLQTSKLFEEECVRDGIPASAIAHGVQQSMEWNRKWVQQDEEGHTMPHDVNQWDIMRMGAKNPSLSGSESGSTAIETATETETATHDVAVTPDLPMQTSPSPPILHRPLALRPFEHAHAHANIHANVHANVHAHDSSHQFYEDGGMECPQSPLTLPSDTQDGPMLYDEFYFDDDSCASVPSMIQEQPSVSSNSVQKAKETLLHALAIAGGDVETKAFSDALLPLVHHYDETGWDARDPNGVYSGHANSRRVEGMWLTLSKATYFGNLGQTADGDPLYTLGRMAFDMFLPTQLVCSLQGNFNPVKIVSPEERAQLLDQCPKSLIDEIGNGTSVLRKYDIVTAFTVEPPLADFPDAPNRDVRRPIKGIMTTCGYVLPDPAVPNRLSIWFTGGRIEPNDDEHDQREWKRLFSRDLPQRSLGERVRLLAASLLMGAEAPTTMNDDGTMNFTFTRPLGGHGVAYVDVIYLDDTLRIVRGHRGTIFTFLRVPGETGA